MIALHGSALPALLHLFLLNYALIPSQVHLHAHYAHLDRTTALQVCENLQEVMFTK